MGRPEGDADTDARAQRALTASGLPVTREEALETAARQAFAEEEAHALSHVSVSTYLVVFLVLAGLTVLSWRLSYVHLGATSELVALVIAVTKASLIVLFFMHLKQQRGAARLYFAVSVLFLLLLLGGMFADVLTRFRPALPRAGAGLTVE